MTTPGSKTANKSKLIEAHELLTALGAADIGKDGRPWTLVERINHLAHLRYMRGYNAKSTDNIDYRAALDAIAETARAALGGER